MLLPFRHRDSPSQSLDARQLESRIAERNQRLAIGIATASRRGAASPACIRGDHCHCQRCRWTEFRGVLMLARGHGKHLQIQHVISETRELPPHLVKGLASVLAQPMQTRLDVVSQLADDLSAIAVDLTTALQRSAGKYVDRIACVSIDAPSIWYRDFDGRPLYHPILEPTSLAHPTGLTVVDDFPRRDLLAAGSGRPLQPLPLWLALGDRRAPVATRTRIVVQLGLDCRFTVLPPSDGLDDWLPEVRYIQTANPLSRTRMLASELSDRQWLELYSNGHASTRQVAAIDQWLRESMNSLEGTGPTPVDSTIDRSAANTRGNQDPFTRGPNGTRTNVLPGRCHRRNGADSLNDALLPERGIDRSIADGIRSMAKALVEFVHGQFLDHPTGDCEFELLIEADEPQGTIFLTEWNQLYPDCPVGRTASRSIPSGFLDPCCVAMLGLLHLDQFPANLPDTTGAEHQRLLGRLTPGRLENWRWAIRSMADYHPPAMRLRDAI